MNDFGLTFGGQVVRVLDGDTIEVEVKRTVRIRLLDCWAPETRTRDAEEKKEGLAAKEFLKQLVDKQPVSVHVPLSAQGKFGDSMSMGRVLGHVYLEDGRDVSALVVGAGFATKEKS